MTPEEEARSHELGNSLEAVQFVDNLCDRIEARQELSRATLDLIEYQTSNKLAGPKPNEQWRSHNNAASSDGEFHCLFLLYGCSPNYFSHLQLNISRSLLQMARQ